MWSVMIPIGIVATHAAYWKRITLNNKFFPFLFGPFGTSFEKKAKNYLKTRLSQNMVFSGSFGAFSQIWPYWAESFFIGFLPFSHKFWYVTPYIFDNFVFDPTMGIFKFSTADAGAWNSFSTLGIIFYGKLMPISNKFCWWRFNFSTFIFKVPP